MLTYTPKTVISQLYPGLFLNDMYVKHDKNFIIDKLLCFVNR